MARRGKIPQGSGITLDESDFGTYLIVHDDGRSILVQTDWEYPSWADTFGWTPRKRKIPRTKEWCDHPGTDGTIDCPVCRTSAMEFINEAREYLDDNMGKRVEDPGHFE